LLILVESKKSNNLNSRTQDEPTFKGFILKQPYKKTLFLFEVFRADQIMTKQGFDPCSIKNAITIITILLLYFERSAKLTINSNYVLAIIIIMAINLDYHRWKVTTCTNILKTINYN